MVNARPRFGAVIFDLGGVLIDWNPRYLLRKLVDKEQVEWYISAVLNREWNTRLDAGLSYAAGAAQLIGLYPDLAPVIEAYVSRWEETLGGAIDGTVEVLRRVKEQGQPLFALTNWSAETFPFARNRFQFLGWFSDILVSGEVGLVKPDRRIFRLAAQRFGIEPASAVFIDDLVDNIEAAASVGFHGLHFRSPQQLEADLTTLGLLPEEHSA